MSDGQQEEKREPNQELVGALRTLEAMQALQNHYGWQVLSQLIQEKIDQRFSECIKQSFSVDELIARQYLTGECKAFLEVKNMPMLLIQMAQETIKSIDPENEDV